MVQRRKRSSGIFAFVAALAAILWSGAALAQQANVPLAAGHRPAAPKQPTTPKSPTPPPDPRAAGTRQLSLQAARQRIRRLAHAHLKSAATGRKSKPSNAVSRSTSTAGQPSHISDADKPLGQSPSQALFSGESNKKLGEAKARAVQGLKLGQLASTSSWVLKTLTALGLIIGLILLLRWVWARMGGRVVASQSAAVEVLARTAVAPKNHVLLLRVGQRLLVVGDSSAGLRTLSQIDDPEEVADLLTAVTSQKDQSISKNFTQLLSRFNGDYDKPRLADEGGDNSEVLFDRTRDGISGLAARIRNVAQRNRAG